MASYGIVALERLSVLAREHATIVSRFASSGVECRCIVVHCHNANLIDPRDRIGRGRGSRWSERLACFRSAHFVGPHSPAALFGPVGDRQAPTRRPLDGGIRLSRPMQALLASRAPAGARERPSPSGLNERAGRRSRVRSASRQRDV